MFRMEDRCNENQWLMTINKRFTILLSLIILGCGTSKEKSKDDQNPLIGRWEAEWRTGPEAFPDVTGIEKFTMDGNFTFNPDGSVQIAAFGFPGCIFSSDTLEHELNWQINNDTLNLRSQDDPYGIPYTIVEVSDQKVELRLMEDIFLTLKR